MIRVGIGYDIHRLEPGSWLMLGGARIPADVRLIGHSDADVVLHACMDALLGAIAAGDIGDYFPPEDERYRGASSVELARVVAEVVRRAGWRIVNLDVAVIAEAPRLAPHVAEMRARTAEALAIDPECVSIKATTNEGVGPEGRREAISAQAVALVERS